MKDVEIISKIAQWLMTHGTSTDFTSFYAEQRSLNVQKCLKKYSIELLVVVFRRNISYLSNFSIMDHLKSLTPITLRGQPSPTVSLMRSTFLKILNNDKIFSPQEEMQQR